MYSTMYQHLFKSSRYMYLPMSLRVKATGRHQLVASHRVYSESSSLPNYSITSLFSSNSCWTSLRMTGLFIPSPGAAD